MLDDFLVPLLWVLGVGLGLLTVGTAAFLLYCWFRYLADRPEDGDDDGGEGGGA